MHICQIWTLGNVVRRCRPMLVLNWTCSYLKTSSSGPDSSPQIKTTFIKQSVGVRRCPSGAIMPESLSFCTEEMKEFPCFVLQIVFAASIGAFDLWHQKDLRRIVGGRPAAPPPVDDPIVYILKDDDYAKVYGDREGIFPNSNYRFSGLRYAEPPVGQYRFQRAKKMKMKGEISGLKFGPPCLQPDPQDPSKTVGSEDCLYLNVYTPKLPDSRAGLPVLLWIHGGGFRRGSAAQYGGGYLARRDVVVVVPQYRLGSLGYLSNNDKDLPGNAALFDLATAAEWVRDYIKFFGGDPNNIIPMGQGSGGSSAMFMGISNMTQGRTKGIVAMSGSALSPNAIDDSPMSRTKVIAEKSGCPESPTLEMVKCLQEIPAEKLIAVESELEARGLEDKGVMGLGSIFTPSPVIEGENDRRSLPPFIAEEPKTSLEMEHFAKVPLLTGVTKHETGGAVTGDLKEKVVSDLKDFPNYVNEVLIKDLVQRQTKRLQNFVSFSADIIKFLTGNYVNIPSNTIVEGINRVIETTSDALFNFPAYLTGSIWSKHNLPTYFYSFDHKGKLKGPRSFFRSLLSGQGEELDEADIVSHGSELPYIFDLRSLDGTPDSVQNDSTPLDPEDEKVRDVLLDMITSFAKNKTTMEAAAGKNKFPSFVSILPTPKFGEHFRECQMQLWSGKKSNKPCSPLKLITDSIFKNFGKLNGEPLIKIPAPETGKIGKPSLIPTKASGRPSVFGNLFKKQEQQP